MATISTYSINNGVVLALQSTYQRFSRIDAICDLLKGIESGEINYDDNPIGGITLMTIAVESLERAMEGAFEDCNKIQDHIEFNTGDKFENLVKNARLVSHHEPGRAQS